MSLVRLVLTMETNQQGNVSLRSFDIERVDGILARESVGETELSLSVNDVVPAFLSRIMHNQNETTVLRMLLEAKCKGTPVYRKQILLALGFDQLLQWNGVSAWLTRNWRAATGNRNADITAIRYELSKDDYEITFASGISDEIIESLAESLGIE